MHCSRDLFRVLEPDRFMVAIYLSTEATTQHGQLLAQLEEVGALAWLVEVSASMKESVDTWPG